MTDGQQFEQAQARIAALESGRLRDAVRTEASKHGMIDVTDLDHLPLDGVTISANGSISGAREFVEKYKTSKPHLFGKTAPTRQANAPARIDNLEERIQTRGIKPGSAEHIKLEQEYLDRWSR